MNIDNPSNWMADNLSVLGPRKLSQITMPASHDSGMYTLSNCTPDISILKHGPYGANACNTQTQSLSIQDQLAAGSRYFDIRPVIDGEGNSYFTGHYALGSPVTLGCNGPMLTDYFAQVAQFMATSQDLVILKFSHYFNRNTKTDSFSTNEYAALITLVKDGLGDLLYTGAAPSGGFINATLDDLIGNGGRVLVVFDTLPTQLHDPSAGIYSYADTPAIGDLTVFDQYADTSNLNTMINDQKTKLCNPQNHDGCLFLLSWTLTQSADQAVICALDIEGSTTILALAGTANAELETNITQWIDDGAITPQTWPNFLYVDDNNEFSLQVAAYLNSQFSTL